MAQRSPPQVEPRNARPSHHERMRNRASRCLKETGFRLDAER
jgi:hypothetical protein